MKSREEMRGLLEVFWRTYVSQFKGEHQEVYKTDLETYRAILAALAEIGLEVTIDEVMNFVDWLESKGIKVLGHTAQAGVVGKEGKDGKGKD